MADKDNMEQKAPVKMAMPDGEIITSYRQAANKKTQVAVLAELNGRSRSAMEQHLVSLGCIQATPPPSFDFLRAAELYSQGLCDLDIAEALGCPKSKVTAWRKHKKFAANYPKGIPKKKQAAPPAPPPTPTPPTPTGWISVQESLPEVGGAGPGHLVPVSLWSAQGDCGGRDGVYPGRLFRSLPGQRQLRCAPLDAPAPAACGLRRGRR